MTDDLKELPPPEKKIVAKTLMQTGYSSRQIEEWLGISDTSVLRASQEATPDELKQFEADFQLRIKEMKQTGIAIGARRLLELLPKERKISEVVRGLEYLENKEQGSTNINMMKLEIIQDASKTE